MIFTPVNAVILIQTIFTVQSAAGEPAAPVTMASNESTREARLQ